jgi:hypothetical protein
MLTSVAIFIFTVLFSIIGWLAKSVLNDIKSEIKQLRRDFKESNHENIETRAIVKSLPCRNGLQSKHCIAVRV